MIKKIFNLEFTMIILYLLFSGNVYGQNNQDKFTQESLKSVLLKKWHWYEVGKIDSIKLLFSENFSSIRPKVSHVKRNDYFALIENKEIHILKINPIDIYIHLEDNNIGIIQGSANMIEQDNGKKINKKILFSDVYKFENNKWINLMWHSNYIE